MMFTHRSLFAKWLLETFKVFKTLKVLPNLEGLAQL